jgi:rhomboid protease GluP
VAQQPWTEVEIAQNYDFQSRLAQATPRAFVTPTLVALNVAVYLAMIAKGVSFMEPSIDSLLKWGANFGPLVTHGEWWRLFAAMFIHIGIIHIGMNMYILWSSGQFTERLFGNFGFLVLYVLAGLGGSLTSVWWKPFTVSAGASGAIFGIYGGLLGYLLIQRHTVPQRNLSALFSSAGTFIAYNLIYSLMSPRIDIAAHLGGFATGFVVGCALARPLGHANLSAQFVRGLLVLVAGGALAAFALTRLPVVDNLQAEAEAIDTLENSSVDAYNAALKKEQTKQMTAAEFNDFVLQKILPPWDASRERISRLHLSGDELERAQKIERFMSLRSEGWKLTAEGIKANDPDLIRQGSSKQTEALALFKEPGK